MVKGGYGHEKHEEAQATDAVCPLLVLYLLVFFVAIIAARPKCRGAGVSPVVKSRQADYTKKNRLCQQPFNATLIHAKRRISLYGMNLT